MQGSTNYALDGAPMYFPQNGAYDNTIAQLIVGDFKQAVYSIRQDVTVKILTRVSFMTRLRKKSSITWHSRIWLHCVS